MLKELKSLIEELNATNSTNTKKEILAKYPELQKIIEYTYNPFKMYGVTSEAIKKFRDSSGYISSGKNETIFGTPLSIPTEDIIFHVLDMLLKRSLTGHLAFKAILDTISLFPEYEEEIFRVLDKDLKIRLGTTEINKVFKDLIPVFDVSLADKFDEKSKVDSSYYISFKADGIRCAGIYKDKILKFYSRNGKEFFTLDVLKESILSSIKGTSFESTDFVLDGELCIVDENGKEDFIAISKEYNKKDHTIKNPMYLLFDWIPYDEFIKGSGNDLYSARLWVLKNNFSKTPNCKVLEQTPYTEEVFKELLEIARKEGYEGLMLRENTTYWNGRSKKLLKVKDFKDGEFKVTGIVNGTIRVINKDTGLEESIEAMSNVIIDYKGNAVEVGSGFSLEDRKFFYSHPEAIVGKVITVKYFQESKNKDGKLSLRFPIFKVLHGDSREV